MAQCRDASGEKPGRDYELVAVTATILVAFYAVYNELGRGFVESVYRRAMTIALREAGRSVDEEVAIRVVFRGHEVGFFRADLVVDRAVVVELKTARAIAPTHESQLLNYLRATTLETGFVLNFGPRPSFKRLAYENGRKGRPQVNAGGR